MPYARNAELPETVRAALPEAAQSVWRNTFNERNESGDSEQASIRKAWGAVKDGWEKRDGQWAEKVAKVDTCLTAKVAKVDESLGLVFGWAIVSEVNGEPYVDTQGDYIPSNVAMKAISEFMRGERVAKAMHVGERVGSVDMAFPMTEDIMKALGIQCEQTGVIVAMRPDSDELMGLYKSGSYTGFSIGGSAMSVEMQ